MEAITLAIIFGAILIEFVIAIIILQAVAEWIVESIIKLFKRRR